MKKFDIFLQKKRILQTVPFIRNGCSILDIGCSDGALFRFYNKKGIEFTGIGIDPDINDDIPDKNYSLIKASFPDIRIQEKFDVITVLAVLEHIACNKLEDFIKACRDRLNPDGKIILTVPHPFVDHLLWLLMFLRLLDGMEAGQHHGFDMKSAVKLFKKYGFEKVCHKTFQLGLNNLFVFSAE